MNTILTQKQLVDLEDPEGCIPLYLRHEDPFCTPVLSHNSSTNNILLKITVPKRTGRKRKRGSQDLYSEDPVHAPSAERGSSTAAPPPPHDLRSHSRRDNPVELLRSLKDNVGRYQVEAVAEIDRTHRFRGLIYVVKYEQRLTTLQVSLISINRLPTPSSSQSSKSWFTPEKVCD